jgi:membrane protein
VPARPVRWVRDVVRSYVAHDGSRLAALLTYYGFLAVFPMLLAGVTVLGLLLRGHPGLQERVLSSSVAEFPVIGADLRSNVRGLPGVSGLVTGLAVGLLGARAFCLQLQRVVEVVWAVPEASRPSWLSRQLRTLWLVALVSVGVLASGAATALASTSVLRLLLLAFVLPGAAAFLAAVLRFVAPDVVATRDLAVAACVAAVGLVGLQLVGAQLVTHLTSSREVYGTFAAVLGLLAWIYLQAQVLVLAMELGRASAHRAPRRS